jgi:hypothetical protein
MLGLRTALVAGLLFSVNVNVFAQDRAILYPGAGVELNGKVTQATSAVSNGDTITTAASAAQLIEKGATLQLQPQTSIKYGDSVTLGCGGVVVNGNTIVHVNGEAIVPAGPAKFEAVNRDSKLLVSVQSGVVSIGGESVSAGQSATRPGTTGCASLAPVAKAGKGMGKALVGAAAAGGAVAGSCLAWWCASKDDISPSKR